MECFFASSAISFENLSCRDTTSWRMLHCFAAARMAFSWHCSKDRLRFFLCCFGWASFFCDIARYVDDGIGDSGYECWHERAVNGEVKKKSKKNSKFSAKTPTHSVVQVHQYNIRLAFIFSGALSALSYNAISTTDKHILFDRMDKQMIFETMGNAFQKHSDN